METHVRRIYLLGFLFALIVGLNTFAGQRYFEKSLQVEIERSISFKLENIIERITSELADAETALTASDIFLQVEQDQEKTLAFFRSFLGQNDSYLAMYLGTEQKGTIYANDWVPPADFDVRTRPWYKGAVEAGELIITAPYLDLAEDRLVVTVAKPLYDREHNLQGVVGVDKSLSDMAAFLAAEKASPNGHSFFLDRSGRIVMCPCSEPEEIHSEQIIPLSGGKDSNLLVETTGFLFTDFQGKPGYLQWQKLPGLDLGVGTFAPVSDFIDSRAQTVQLLSTILLTFSSALLLLFFFQHRQIIRPLKELDRDILAISLEDNPTYRLPDDKTDSFQLLRTTINQVLAKTEEQFEQVIYQQEELSAAYEQLAAHQEELRAQYDEIKQHRDYIQFLADHDSLTGLYNRRKFEEDLGAALRADKKGSVLMLDIDNFKNINDIQGHVYGDQVLQAAAQVFLACNKPDATPYRFGGDEFLLVLDDIVQPGEIGKIIIGLQKKLANLDTSDGRRIHLTVSVGIVSYPRDGATVDDLLSKADIAMHNAKEQGKDRYLFFQGDMATTFSEQVELEQILQAAVAEEKFTLFYQPVVDAQTGQISYFEALLRLQEHPISPAVFIETAEKSNLILPIGRWVIKAAISQLGQWTRQGVNVKPIAVNLSPKQFYDAGLADFIKQELHREAVDPALLEMEITESVFIDNMAEALSIIAKIKKLGVKLTLDDFGVGYSSINYITRIPVDRIKLDKSFIAKLSENLPVMAGLIAIAHGLQMDVVGEGVENTNEAIVLQGVGCDYLQGYLFSMPVPADQLELTLDYGHLLKVD